MTFSLYDATVPTFQQTLGAVSGLLAKAEAFCADSGIAPADLIEARLADDMLPFGYQVRATSVHSMKAIEGAKSGTFSPSRDPWPTDFAALNAVVAEAKSFVDAVTRDEINNLVGRDAAFVMGERRMDFTAENFLMSFSMPNFYFHATTAYDILRWKGVQVGKMDFMGRPRMKAKP